MEMEVFPGDGANLGISWCNSTIIQMIFCI